MSHPTSIENEVVFPQEVFSLFPQVLVSWSTIFEPARHQKREQAENCGTNTTVKIDVPAAEYPSDMKQRVDKLIDLLPRLPQLSIIKLYLLEAVAELPGNHQGFLYLL